MTRNITTTPAPAQRERVLTVRITWDQLDALKCAARDRGTTMSTLVRERLSGKK